MTAGATTATITMVGMTAAVPVITKLIDLWKKLQVAMVATNVSMGTIGLVAVGIGALAGAGYTVHLRMPPKRQKRWKKNAYS